MTLLQGPLNDKSEIRRVFEGLIANHTNDKELCQIRHEMSDNLNVPLKSLASVSAYVRYCATQAIENHNLHGKLDSNALIETAHFMRLAKPAEFADELASFSLEAGISFDEYNACLREYYTRIEKKPEGEIEVISAVAVEEVEKTNTICKGDIQNYDFEAKRLWRQEWVNFIEKHMTPLERANARVLCLPGENCELEVNHYLSLGIPPQNIFAVERSEKVWKSFEANAKALGINPIHGDLIDVIKDLPKPFHIVSLDFLGPLCDGYLEILQEVPLAGKTLLMTNTQGAREGAGAQFRMFEDIVTHDAERYKRHANRSWKKVNLNEAYADCLAGLHAEKNAEFFSDDKPLAKELRAAALDAALLNTVGLKHSPYYESVVKNLFSFIRINGEVWERTVFSDLENFKQFIAQNTLAIFQLFRELPEAKLGMIKLHEDFASLGTMVLDVLTARPRVKNIERVSYVSEGESKRTYHSRFAVLDNGTSQYLRWGKAAEKFFDMYLDHKPKMIEAVEKSDSECVPLSYNCGLSIGGLKTKLIKAGGRKRIVKASFRHMDFKLEDKVYSFDMRSLMQDIRDFTAWQSRFIDIDKPLPPIKYVGQEY
jgi:hypothetical protein